LRSAGAETARPSPGGEDSSPHLPRKPAKSPRNPAKSRASPRIASKLKPQNVCNGDPQHLPACEATMIDLSTECPINLNEATRFVPASRGAKRTHLSTILRWILTGAKAHSGEVIRLEALRLGGKWVTSREALQRFAERLTPSLEGRHTATPRPPTTRQRASEQAAKELKRIGI
jgi:hypothetical protein